MECTVGSGNDNKEIQMFNRITYAQRLETAE